MIQETIITYIQADSSFIDIANDRIYPVQAPENAITPYVVYTFLLDDPFNSLDGDANLDMMTMDITVWADTYLEAHNLVAVVRNSILNSGVSATTENISDTFDNDTKRYGVELSLRVFREVSA